MGSCTLSRVCGFKQKLGGGFKYVLFSSLFGDNSHFDCYFSKGLKPPTRKTILFFQKLFGEMFQIGDAKEELCVL